MLVAAGSAAPVLGRALYIFQARWCLSPASAGDELDNFVRFQWPDIFGRLVFDQNILDFLSFSGIWLDELEMCLSLRGIRKCVDNPKLILEIVRVALALAQLSS